MENRVPSAKEERNNVSDTDDEEATLDFPYNEERNVGQCILMLFTWATLVRKKRYSCRKFHPENYRGYKSFLKE